jgi:type I restriction enzyme S subunit
METDETWPLVPFEDVIDFQEGPGIMARDFREEGVPLVRLAGLTRDDLLAGCDYLEPEMVERKWSHFALKEGDILLSTSASLGRTARVSAMAVGAIPYTGLIRLRPRDDRVRPEYVKRLVQDPAFQLQIEAMGAGSVMRHFGPSHLRVMTVRVPPPEEQRRIAGVLGALDDKIEHIDGLARRIRSSVEASFQSWPWHGYTDVPVGEVVELVYGKALKQDERRPGPVAVFGSAGQVGWHDEPLSAGPGIVVGRKGHPGAVTWSSSDFFVIDTAFYAKPRESTLSFPYLFHALRLVDFRAVASDSAVPGLNRDLAYQRVMKLHSDADIDSFDRFASPLMALEARLQRESASLAVVRDALLPKLVSGKIRVPESYEPDDVLGTLGEQAAAS